MTIRYATPDDILALLELGEEMHAESRYSTFPYSADKVDELMRALLADNDGLAIVAEDEAGDIVGGFLGSLYEHPLLPIKASQDFALFVTPSKRGATIAARLVDAYVGWAKGRGVELIQVGSTTGVNVEAATRLFRGLGFVQVGNLFEFVGGANA